MTTTPSTETVPAEVRLFVAAVRRLLADLPADEAREMTDGLEADLADLVSERGPQALGDPAEYARELRAAAGLPDVGTPRTRRAASERVHGLLDALHERWDRAVGGLPGAPWEFLVSLRPAWWVVRAWLALELADLLWGGGSYNYGLSLLPSLTGSVGLNAVLLVLAAIPSIALGQGRLWPTRRTAVGRLVLLGLNALAVVTVPVVATSLVGIHTVQAYAGGGDGFGAGYQAAIDQGVARTDKAGMYVDGRWITNIFPYDAHGRPLVGVQLFDQIGKPLTIGVQANYREQPNGKVAGPFVPYAWSDGRVTVRNAFPLAERLQAAERVQQHAFDSARPPRIGPFPEAHVGKVTMPGVRPSVVRGR